MGAVRFADIAERPNEILDWTSLTPEEFAMLLEPFEVAFQAYMAEWRLDGLPRTARRYTTYTNCPLPTPQDRLLFVLSYLKTNPLQAIHGRTFGMPQNKANQWIHVLLPVLQQTLLKQGDTPSRSLAQFAERLGLNEEAVQDALEEVEGVPAEQGAAAPLFVTTAPSGQSRAPKTRMNRKAVTVG